MNAIKWCQYFPFAAWPAFLKEIINTLLTVFPTVYPVLILWTSIDDAIRNINFSITESECYINLSSTTLHLRRDSVWVCASVWMWVWERNPGMYWVRTRPSLSIKPKPPGETIDVDDKLSPYLACNEDTWTCSCCDWCRCASGGAPRRWTSWGRSCTCAKWGPRTSWSAMSTSLAKLLSVSLSSLLLLLLSGANAWSSSCRISSSSCRVF